MKPLRLVNLCAIALLLGYLFGTVVMRAEDGDCDSPNPAETCLIVYTPGLCGYLEPYSYWWYFWNCGQVNGVTDETVTYQLNPDGTLTTETMRTYPDGSVIRTERRQRLKR